MVKDNKDEASCSICGRILKTNNGSTKGVREHLIRMHDVIPDDPTTFLDPKSVPKPKEVNPDNLKSFVWKYMVKDSKYEASCSICGRVLKTSDGSTRGARDHLFRVHNLTG